MADYLVIVESPTKAKTIGRFLGSKYKVEASVGHLRDLPVSKLAIDIDNDFKPQYTNIRGKSDLIKTLKKAAKESKKVFLATDPDREGEAISWHLAHLLEIDPNTVCRVTYNEITKKAVTEAIKNPRTVDMGLVDAYQARRVLDRIVGYQISPVLWKKVKKGLSAGRVQSVVARMICDREDEIEAFEPKEYWTIAAELQKQGKAASFVAKFHGNSKGKIALKNKEDADKVLAGLEGAVYRVRDIRMQEKKKSPAPPFITSTLQQEASRKLGFSVSKTMSVVQSLYEGVNVGASGITGLVNVAYNESNATIIIVDNSITGMTGHQQNPAMGKTIRGEETRAVDLVALCHAVGVDRVRVADPFDLQAFEAAVREEIAADEPSVIIAQRPCALLKYVKYTGACEINDKCKKCKKCMKLGCPAISVCADGSVKIDTTQCNGCGLCIGVCPFGAIEKKED